MKAGRNAPEGAGVNCWNDYLDYEGGHDVPTDKLIARFPRSLANLKAAIRELPCVLVFDNDDLRTPFRHVATFVDGRAVLLKQPVPFWLQPVR